MKFLKLFYLSMMCISVKLMAQADKTIAKGNINGKVFFNYHINKTSSKVIQKSAFQLTKVYIGYIYEINDKLRTTVLFDAGKSTGGSDYSVFVKNAKLDYLPTKWVTFSVGIIGLKQHKEQENFWGHRYVYKSFTDQYAFGATADLGLNVMLKLHSNIIADIFFVNGEGYKKVQDHNGNTRVGLNIAYMPSKNWLLKMYIDNMEGIDIGSMIGRTRVNAVSIFAGYTIKEIFKIGVEYNYLQNGTAYNQPVNGKILKGYSIYSRYKIDNKWDVFGRYDNFISNQLEGQLPNSNDANVGETIIEGVEFKPTKEIKTAIAYKYTDVKEERVENISSLYFNLSFVF